MRGHDQSSRDTPDRTRSRRILSTLMMLLATIAHANGKARGQDSSGDNAPGVRAARCREPVNLAARRVAVWKQNGVQWIVLSGESAILQGAEGIRSKEAVVRVAEERSSGHLLYTLDVYAEGVDGSSSKRPTRMTFQTQEAVLLRPYERPGLTQLEGPPRGVGIWLRSGFAVKPVEKVASRARAGAERQVHIAQKPNLGIAAGPADLVLEAVPSTVQRPQDAGTPPVVARVDPDLVRTQYLAQPPVEEGPADTQMDGLAQLPPASEATPLGSAPTVPTVPPTPDTPTTELAPLPAPGTEEVPAPASPPRPRSVAPTRPVAAPGFVPVTPGSQRITRVYPRNGNPNFFIERLPVVNGLDTLVIRGGVNIVTESPNFGILDISADHVIIWRRVDEKGKSFSVGPNGEQVDSPNQPMEVYLEGDVVIRQDERKVAGNGDQKTIRARAAYYDLLSERLIADQAELNVYAPGLTAPTRVISPRIEQYQPLVMGPNGNYTFGLPQIRADQTMTTASRFANPGYRFNSKSVDMFRIVTNETDPVSGKPVADPKNPNPPQDLTWRIDARQNVFWMGKVPVFYWPRVLADADDLEPPLRQFTFRTNNYFGQQVLSDWNGFRLLGLKRPKFVDIWNVDLDYLSARTKMFPALGSEIGWFGGDLINDLSDPYGRAKGQIPTWTKDYFGYFDIWGLRDYGRDTLGAGPAIITNNIAAGNVGYQRGGGGPLGSVPAFQDFRGRLSFRHMQRFLPDDDAHAYEDFRAQLEVGLTSDRYFLEEYYKRLFDIGLDQETLFYLIKQKQNTAWTVWAEANLQPWNTESQWLPKLDYYRLGDSLLGDRLTYFQHTGVDYANVHTANEVNNPHIFAYMPYDPISNTSGVWKSGRAYTNHEVDFPVNVSDVLKVVPYVQGQAIGWTNQIDGQSAGRVWGGVGARASMMASKVYPSAESELFNVHGINHKINLEADFRTAYSNRALNRIGVQDDLDDNTYEGVRRYFALTNYAGGILPQQYDPRYLILRRTLSPITGTTDVQGTIDTLRLGLHQRLQTKRGPEGKRNIIDYMTFDLDTTYFPNAARDNFNTAFGQNTYNYQWFLGDRMSILSYGWFEFWKLTGNPIYKTNTDRHNNPFGLNVITSGISLNRPPRGNIYIGYTVVDTGPIKTSALTTSLNYWLSPKYYGTYTTMYDFGNGILLAAIFSLTRIGPDYISSLGLTVDPQRQSYMFAIQVSPRFSPNMRLGSGGNSSQFDPRFAPTQ